MDIFKILSDLFGGQESEKFEQYDKRLDSLELRLQELESSAVRESDVELLRSKVESVSEDSGDVSKQVLVGNRILELVGRGLSKSDVRDKVVNVDSLCSDSYFYENWNTLLEKSYIVQEDSEDSVRALVDEVDRH